MMFRPVFGSNESGRFVSAEIMFRDQACPHCGWSSARVWKFGPRLKASSHVQNSLFFILVMAKQSTNRER